ncbi:hillarin-like [Babylonia areolata]|uniref:hillarin-like n=1 Tax=Babylonia areolata TaxID=304850 RepID=UPI003FD01F65
MATTPATQDEAAARGFRRLSSLFLPPRASATRCHRCQQPVYQQEKMGPVHDVLFHKSCFKCASCGLSLTLKNYWSNQRDGADCEIYCATHVPRIGGSAMGPDAMDIQRALAAQRDVHAAAMEKVGHIRQAGIVPNVDGGALDIRAAVGAQYRLVDPGQRLHPHTSGVDASALHIQGALHAQLLQRRQHGRLDKHHYPPHIARKREEVFAAQKRLEETLRVEEDALIRGFQEEREQTKDTIRRQIDTEWEQRLTDLTNRYHMHDPKASAKKGTDHKLKFENEKKELEKQMTVKKKKVTQTATLRLREKEQRATADMVKKQSEQMLNLLAAKQTELKEELKKTLRIKKPPPQLLTENGVPQTAPPPEAAPAAPEAEAEAVVVVAAAEDEGAENSEELLAEVMEDVLQMPAVTSPASPKPPVLRKKELFPDASVFKDIDEQVIKVAEGEQPTYTDLVRQLTENLLTDLEKVRAIYRWITVKDLNVMEFGDDIEAESPMGLLRGIKMGTETYHVLFMRLCSYAGLHCVEVKGHSKSVGYEPGMKITPDIFQNTWNAVLVCGEWRLVQCNWGARHLVLSKDPQEKFRNKDHIRYQYDEHYFLTDPDEFIQEFWPLEEEWQLLPCPISLEEFEALPFVRSIFFHYGMHFERHCLAVMDTDEKGGCRISLKVPEEHENDLIFYYQLRFADKERLKDLTYKGAALDRFVFQTMVDNTITFSVHVPTAASYFFEIFATKFDESSVVHEDNATMAPLRLKCACQFKLVCRDIQGKMHPLPECAPGEWGPKKAIRHFGMLPVLSEGPAGDGEKVGILMAKDTCKVRFRMPRPLVLVAKLRMNQVEEKTLDPFVSLSEEGQVVTVSAMLPQEGQYGLDIFARPKTATDTSVLSHACKLLINCSQVSSPVDLPRLPEPSRKNKWGPTAAFDVFALELLSHKDSTISLGGGAATCTIELHVPQGVQLSYQFLRQPDEDLRKQVEACRDTESPHRLRYTLSLPRSGNYMLCLYARREDSEDRALINVYNYLLRNVPPAPDPEETPSRKSSIFKKGLFSSKKDKAAKGKDKSLDRLSDKSSDKSV